MCTIKSKPRSLNPMLYLCRKTSVSALFFLILLTGCFGNRPESIGQFVQCPDKPNCVSSKSSISLHKVAPLTYNGTPREAKEILLKILKSMPRTRISIDRDNFLHVEFTSKIFQFVDDVEFYFDKAGTINFRSASRVGHSDMGVNRERMEEIRHLFKKTLSHFKVKDFPN